jgi:hypothetical protein
MRSLSIAGCSSSIKVPKVRYNRPTVTAPSQPELTVTEEPADDMPYEEPDEVEGTFAAGDTERGEKLQEALDCEKNGLRLLAKATLLRVAIQCDDRGETFHAKELRERAQILNTESVDALSAEEVWQPTTLQFCNSDDAPTTRGA